MQFEAVHEIDRDPSLELDLGQDEAGVAARITSRANAMHMALAAGRQAWPLLMALLLP